MSIAVAALVGHGVALDRVAGGDIDAYRWGAGARLGATLAGHLYVGGTFIVHDGTHLHAEGAGGALYDARYHATYGGAEVGWDFVALRGRLLVRPYAGTGVLASVGHTDVRRASTGTSQGFFYVAPGIVAAVRAGDVFAGVDLRMPLPFAELWTRWAPAVMLTAGVTLAR